MGMSLTYLHQCPLCAYAWTHIHTHTWCPVRTATQSSICLIVAFTHSWQSLRADRPSSYCQSIGHGCVITSVRWLDHRPSLLPLQQVHTAGPLRLPNASLSPARLQVLLTASEAAGCTDGAIVVPHSRLSHIHTSVYAQAGWSLISADAQVFGVGYWLWRFYF